MGVNARRIRGAFRMGLTWSVAWALLGGILSLTAAAGLPDHFQQRFMLRLLLSGAAQFAVGGFLTGAAFSGVLSLFAARGTLPTLRYGRFTVWGAAGGAVPAAGLVGFAAATNGNVSFATAAFLLGTGMFLGCVSAGVTLGVAQLGIRPSDRQEPALTGIERDRITDGATGNAAPQRVNDEHAKVRL
jgi:hypothetical protein